MKKRNGYLNNTSNVGFVLSILLVVLFIGMSCRQVLAESMEERAQGIYDATMSPFCPGRTLSACPSSEARRLRETIFTWLKEGMSDEKIWENLLGMYGDDVRGTPSKSGFGLMGWAMPVFFVLVGIIVVGISFKVMGRKVQEVENGGSPSVEYAEKIKEELKRKIY